MKQVAVTGVGASDPISVRPGGAGKVFFQAQTSDAATEYYLAGRASPNAPWKAIFNPTMVEMAAAYDWRPEFRIQVTSGVGTITAWVVEMSE